MRSARARLLGGLGAAAALTMLVLLVVLPALAAPGDLIPPASTAGVTPTEFTLPSRDVQNCASFYPSGGAPAYAFYIKDVHSGTYTDPATGATFTIDVAPPNTGNPANGGGTWPYYNTYTYLSFTSTGAQIDDVGVYGANERTGAHYSYTGQPGGSVTSDGYLHADLVSGWWWHHQRTTRLDRLDDLEFCYGHYASQTVNVFDDANHNGQQDGGESPIASPNWTLDLYDSSDTAVGSPVTTTNGSYTFSNLTVGATYTVCIVGQDGWEQTLPDTGGTANCTGAGESPVGYTFTAGGGAATDFGEVQHGSISGSAYLDPNGNGTDTSGLGGLTVTLYDSGGNAVGTTTTASDGTYSFSDEYAGSYTLCIEAPSGHNTQTVPSSGGVACSTEGTTGYQLTLDSSGATGEDFAFEPWGSVSGNVYNDANQNGQNDDSAPQSGWTVTLYGGSGTPPSVTTDDSGDYSFADVLEPGTQYTVCEHPPADDTSTWVQTEPLPSSQDVCQNLGSGNLLKGYQVSDSDTGWPTFTNDDFGNTIAQATCETEGGSVTYTTSSFGDTIETCKLNQTYSFATGTVNSGTYDGYPYVSVFAGDQSSGNVVETLENITLPDPIDPNTHQPQFTGLLYTDVFPYDLNSLQPMGFCDFGPPPTLTPSLPDGQTSCLVTYQVTPANGGTFTATILTGLDGFKLGHGQ